MQHIRNPAQGFFRYFVHKLLPIQKNNVWKLNKKIYKIFSNINQFIYTLVLNYMLAYRVIQIFCSQGYSYIKCVCPKRGITQSKIYEICSNVNHFTYTLSQTCMPNIRILTYIVLKVFCSEACSYTKCLCLKKGNNSIANLWNRFNIQLIYTLVCNYMPTPWSVTICQISA